MKKILLIAILFTGTLFSFSQEITSKGDSLKNEGLLMPAIIEYGKTMVQQPSSDISYKIASTAALMWTSSMRDTAFYFLDVALREDSTIDVLYDPHFLGLISDVRWKQIEDAQIKKYESKFGAIENKEFAKALFRMIIKDQGLMYAGNIERKYYLENGGYFRTPAIFPLLAMEENNKKENEDQLISLLDRYGWPKTSEVTEYAAAAAALVINHASHELRKKYFPLLEDAFNQGEAQALRYAKMKDRLLVEEGEPQCYGTQVKFVNMKKIPYPIREAEQVDERRAMIGLGPLKPYLKEKFNIDLHNVAF